VTFGTHTQSSTAGRATWTAGDQTRWNISWNHERIELETDGESFELSSEDWPRDIYVAPHGGGYIIRFETFDRSVGFVVPRDEAAPFLEHLNHAGQVEPATEKNADAPFEAPPSPREELLWPKVSPLAVWALIASSVVFLPYVGWLAAFVTVLLLLAHRAMVPRRPAYRHSRTMCVVALILMLAGLIVSSIGTKWMSESRSLAPGEFDYIQSHSVDADLNSGLGAMHSEPAEHETVNHNPPPLLMAGFFDREHNWGLIAAGLFVVLLALTFHEAAHAISAWWLGDDLARRLGRVTLNPVAHVDPFGTVILPLILFLSGIGVFGWAKPVPVQVENLPRHRRAHILISIAGPGSNLLMAAISLMMTIGLVGALRLLAPDISVQNLTLLDFQSSVQVSGVPLAPVLGPLLTILKLSFIINVFLAFFNLIPIPPLDGSWVLEHLFPRTLGPIYERIRPYAFLLFLGLIYTGVLKYLLYPVIYVLARGFFLISLCTGP
jgi:Zn-dependent protease